MTEYYYIASDVKLVFSKGQLDAWPNGGMAEYIPEFDFPIQLEMLSPEKEKELFPLYLFIKYHFEGQPGSTIQIAHYLNSNIEACRIDKKRDLRLRELTDPRQLALEIGEMVTIKK